MISYLLLSSTAIFPASRRHLLQLKNPQFAFVAASSKNLNIVIVVSFISSYLAAAALLLFYISAD